MECTPRTNECSLKTIFQGDGRTCCWYSHPLQCVMYHRMMWINLTRSNRCTVQNLVWRKNEDETEESGASLRLNIFREDGARWSAIQRAISMIQFSGEASVISGRHMATQRLWHYQVPSSEEFFFTRHQATCDSSPRGMKSRLKTLHSLALFIDVTEHFRQKNGNNCHQTKAFGKSYLMNSKQLV